jgi:hypothetical protein
VQRHYGPIGTQRFAVLVEVDQCEGYQQPVMILLQAPVAYLKLISETKDALQDAKWRFHLGAYTSLGAVLPPLLLIGSILEPGLPRSHVLSIRSDRADNLFLPLITTLSPHLLFIAMKQIGQHVHVGNRSCRGAHRMDDATLLERQVSVADLVVSRQREPECGTSIHRSLYPYTPSMAMDNSLHNSQSDPCTFKFVRPMQTLENAE